MPQRLRVTLLSMVLAAAFLIGGASQCQAAAAGRSTVAALTAPGWMSAAWAAVRVQVIPNSGKHLETPARDRKPSSKGLLVLVDEGCIINPNGSR
jgi:hypothetical protein